jgi:addiction module HigA family antidote
MKTRFIEATNGPCNWGKFVVGRFDHDEIGRPSHVDPGRYPLLRKIGWHDDTIWVLDLQTREGAAFTPGGHAKADLDKSRVWVCPLFEPFLTWLWQQDLSDLDALPSHVDLPKAPFALHGYRRDGRAPGEYLREELERRGITQLALAQQISRPAAVINAIVNSKKSITAATALQLERALGIDAGFWLDLQARHLLHEARKRRVTNRQRPY